MWEYFTDWFLVRNKGMIIPNIPYLLRTRKFGGLRTRTLGFWGRRLRASMSSGTCEVYCLQALGFKDRKP